MAVISNTTGEVFTADDSGPVVILSIAFSKNTSASDDLSMMDTYNPYRALLSRPLVKALTLSASHVSTTSITICSEVLVTRLFKLPIASYVNFSTMLWTSDQNNKEFSAGRGFPNASHLDLECSQSHPTSTCSITSISWSALVWVYSSRLCGRLSSLFEFTVVLLEPRVRHSMRLPDFSLVLPTSDLDCADKAQLVFNWAPPGRQNFRWDW